MSLLFNQISPSEPQTHVFMIGVGGYPYLQGGFKAKTQQIDVAQQLGQLTSPPISLEAFYNSVIGLHRSNSWLKSLGSVEVLLSSPPGGKEVFTNELDIESATKFNIENAYFRWKERCNSHEENVAIFFFCGHGFDKVEHYLLTEDFGERPENPWSGSFAFDSTRRAFHACKANTQLFFVDSCRQYTFDMLRFNLAVTPIEPPDITCPDCKYDLTQKASASKESSYGMRNGLTFYTKALVEALEGKAATNLQGWQINTATLSLAIDSLIQGKEYERSYKQRCSSNIIGNTSIIKLDIPPCYSLEVTCSPTLALSCANLSWIELKTNLTETRVGFEQTPWNVNLKAGIYKFQADFPGKGYKDNHNFRAIEPFSSLHPEILYTPKIK